MSFRVPVVWLGMIPLLVGCGSPPPRAIVSTEPARSAWFQDVTEAMGIDFHHDVGPVERLAMPQAIGSGVAIFDADGDGRLDLLFLQNGGPESTSRNRLYLQTIPGHFQDASGSSGLAISGHNMGVAVGDVDSDGRPDVAMSQYGGLRLFRNLGQGQFEDVTEHSGLTNPGWGTSCSFLDYDRDGRLDLVVACYVDYDPTWHCTTPSGARDYCAPRTFPGRVSRLYRNLGPDAQGKVRFADVSLASGLGKKPGPGLGVLCYDFDGDGWVDIFVANDGAANHLWFNNHDGTFREEAVPRGLAFNGLGKAEAGMGVALGDADGDGLPDLFVTHLTEEMHTLWRQHPRGSYHDRTSQARLSAARWRGTGFGTVLADFDNNGVLDLAIANGRVSRGPSTYEALGPHWTLYAERNQLLINDGTGRFTDVSSSEPAFCGLPNVGRGLAVGDLDGDGALDLVVTTAGGPARIFRNVAPERGHWVRLEMVDSPGPRRILGCEVKVRLGTRTLVRSLQPASSYLCSHEPSPPLGVGQAERIDSFEVTWPDGQREAFPGGPVDQLYRLQRGRGEAPR